MTAFNGAVSAPLVSERYSEFADWRGFLDTPYEIKSALDSHRVSSCGALFLYCLDNNSVRIALLRVKAVKNPINILAFIFYLLPLYPKQSIMCYRPVHITNPIKHYNPLLDATSLDVPCGSCPECIAARKSEWFVRLYYEYLETKNLGGYTLYLTLSYRPEDLPLYNGVSFKPSTTFRDKKVLSYDVVRLRNAPGANGTGVFNRADLTTWTKSVKNRLQTAAKLEHLTDFKRWSKDIKFFVVPEFGGKLSRPHYHALVFCKSRDLPFDKLLNIVKSSWEGYSVVLTSKSKNSSNISHQVNGFGFCMHGSEGWKVANPHAINYLLKYLSKDMCTDNVVLGKLLKQYPCEKNTDLYKSIRLATRPFVYASPKLGQFIGSKDDAGNYINITSDYKVKVSEVVNGTSVVKEYGLPRSIVKLIFHERVTRNVPDSDPSRIRPYVRQTRYAITEDGIRYRAHVMAEMAHNTHYVYNSFRRYIEFIPDARTWFDDTYLGVNFDWFKSQVVKYAFSQLDFLCQVTACDLDDFDVFENWKQKLRLRSWRISDPDTFTHCVNDVPSHISYTKLDPNFTFVYKVFFDWLLAQQDKLLVRDEETRRLQSLHRFINSNSI